jgi:hypothetical protein
MGRNRIFQVEIWLPQKKNRRRGENKASQACWPLHTFLLCPHSEHQKHSFQSKQCKHFHHRNRFISCETGSDKVKLPEVGSNAIVPVPVGGRAQQTKTRAAGSSHNRQIELVSVEPSDSDPCESFLTQPLEEVIRRKIKFKFKWN